MADDSNSGTNAILLVILVIILAGGAYFFLNHGASKSNIEVNIPNPVSGTK